MPSHFLAPHRACTFWWARTASTQDPWAAFELPLPVACASSLPAHTQTLYERVCDLREKRLDEDDLITEFQKAMELLKKEKEMFAKKQRLLEQSLGAIQLVCVPV